MVSKEHHQLFDVVLKRDKMHTHKVLPVRVKPADLWQGVMSKVNGLMCLAEMFDFKYIQNFGQIEAVH